MKGEQIGLRAEIARDLAFAFTGCPDHFTSSVRVAGQTLPHSSLQREVGGHGNGTHKGSFQ